MTHLEIGLARDGASRDTAPSWNVVRGGAMALLSWLETQLGLQRLLPGHTERALAFAALLDGTGGSSYSESFATDRWATAMRLLSLRDELLMAGWDGRAAAGLPRLVNDLAAAEERARNESSGEANGDAAAIRCGAAERIGDVLAALDAGQLLPDHRCELEETVDLWPARWRPLLERLHLAPVPASPVPPDAHHAGTGGGKSLPPLSHLTATSVQEACDFLAAILTTACSTAHAADRAILSETAILCEDPEIALRLDGTFARRGVPTMGASLQSSALPLFQVLPLTLQLCREPVDPQILLDFVSLPVGPIPKRAGLALADALGDQPGMGSYAWERAREELVSETNDPGGKTAARLAEWLDLNRVAQGEPLPAPLVIERCAKVTRWAIGRAAMLEGNETRDAADRRLAATFHALAGQAATLSKLVEGHGEGTITEPQLARLLHAAQEDGITYRPHIEAATGPLLAGGLADITHPVARLIWLGTGTGDPPSSPWTALDLERLRSNGVDIDDGSRALRALRAAERSGLGRVGTHILAITLPGDDESRPHPLWLETVEAHRAARGGKPPPPTAIEELIRADRREAISPWTFITDTFAIEPPQPARVRWNVDRSLLGDRTSSSASSLTMRLSCPLQWVLNYRARLRPSAIAGLPGSFQLKGTFCHRILEEVFGGGGELPTERRARAAVKERFETRLPRDAAPLAQPTARGESLAMKKELIDSAALLVKTLRAGGYRVAAMEAHVHGEIAGRKLIGFIDCLARRPDGGEAVIDFKYAGRKYRSLLAEGRAVQLATYAAARAQEAGVESVAVAYLILCDSRLHTPEGSPLAGSRRGDIVGGAPGIESVWNDFVAAIEAADGWLAGDEPIVARPLQDPEAWPEGCELVIREKEADRACTYCPYDILCGRSGLE